MVKEYDFSRDKSLLLKETRGISFEDVIVAIESGYLLDIVDHPNQEKYQNQKIYVLDIEGYVYLVPFIYQTESRIFLKTVFKSRKMTKQYIKIDK